MILCKFPFSFYISIYLTTTQNFNKLNWKILKLIEEYNFVNFLTLQSLVCEKIFSFNVYDLKIIDILFDIYVR